LIALAAEKNPLGKVSATLHLNQTRQTMRGFGGNFAQPRYGATEPLDPVGEYNLKNLRVVHARIGIPLNHWLRSAASIKTKRKPRPPFCKCK
jgi:Na+-translocating ferredoxin:NAD+ oxidoreductase RnfC subunit